MLKSLFRFTSILLIISSLMSFGCSSVDLQNRSPSSDLDLNEAYKIWNQHAQDELTELEEKQLKTIQENFVRFMLEASGETPEMKYELFQEARQYMAYDLKGFVHKVQARKMNLDSSNSFQKWSPIKAPKWTLKEEIKFIQDQIPEYERLKPDEIESLNAMITHALQNTSDDDEFAGVLDELADKPDDRSRGLAVVEKFETRFEKYKSRIRNMGEELARGDRLALDDPEVQKFIKLFLNYYYQSVDEDVLKNIINDMIEKASGEITNEDLMLAVFKNSGPGLGKLLQQLTNEAGVSDEMADLMRTIESENKTVPYHLVKEVVANDEGGFQLSRISKTSLGTGTMAQVNKATLKRSGEKTDVALRFLKPGVSEMANSDIKILQDFVNDVAETGEISSEMLPNIKKLVRSLEEFLYSELDIEGTIEKQLLAKRVYERSVRVTAEGEVRPVQIHVPDVYLPEQGRATQLHIQEYIEFGEKFDSLPTLNHKQRASRALIEMWFEEALLESGVIHADLHQGNFTVLVQDSSDDMKIVLFDFGMSEQLDETTRRAFLLLGSGGEYEDSYLISKGFHLMGANQSKSEFKRIQALVDQELKKGSKGAVDWVFWGMHNGLVHSNQLGPLARGASLVNQLPKIIDDEEFAKDQVEKMAAKRIRQEYFKRDYQFPLTRYEISRLGISVVSKNCRDLMDKFLKR